MIPVTTKDGYIITVEKLPEDISMFDHFVNECGWLESDLDGMYDDNFFCAKVAVWTNGKEMGAAYLGSCYYNSLQDFIQSADYFDDLIDEAIEDAKAKAKQ